MKQIARATLALVLATTLLSAAPAPSATAAGKSSPTAQAPARAASQAPAARPSSAAQATPRAATSERLDGIAAVVNDDVVLQSDVEEQLYLFLMRAQSRPDSSMIDTLRTQILNQLIDEKLIVAEAKRQGITTTESEVGKQVDKAIDDARERLGGSAAFEEQLARENTTEPKLREKYKADLERQMLAQKLVEKQFPRRRGSVTAVEAEAYFKANRDKFPKVPPEVKVQVIQIAPHADSVADVRAKAKAVEARKRVAAGEKFAKVAADLSEDPNTARAGGDLGFIPPGALDGPLDEVVQALKPNVLSQPVRSAVGWHIVEVIERDTMKTRAGRDTLDADGKPLLEAHLRHILIRAAIEDADIERARALADRVHAEAMKGADFGALVRRYSQYEGKQSEDGDLGFISLGTLPPAIRSGLDTVAVGKVSDVLENQVGFNIFKVNDRKAERAYELDEIRGELPDVVDQMKRQERYEEWLKVLRTKAHIEVRNS